MAQTFTAPAGTDPLNAAVKTTLVDRDEALRTLFSGATEPSSPVAYMLWADTTTKILKQRNAANSAWVDVLPLGDNMRLQTPFRCSGALAAETLQMAVPMASKIDRVLIVPNTTTLTSVAASKEWTFLLKNQTTGNNLFSATPSTATTVSGVGGGEMMANTAYTLLANQNQSVAANSVLRFTIASVGSPTAVSDVSIVLVMTRVGV